MAEYIEREALLAEYDRVHVGPPGGARKLIEEAPAADVVPVVHGRWMWELADNGWANWTCSGCGYTRNVDVHVVVGWNYCPYCGAHMKDGE